MFCIGFNKGGSVSRHEAFVILGYSNLHRDGAEARRAVRRAMQRFACFPAGDRCPVLAALFPWRSRYGIWREPASLETT
jgi:hypothetical protein